MAVPYASLRSATGVRWKIMHVVVGRLYVWLVLSVVEPSYGQSSPYHHQDLPVMMLQDLNPNDAYANYHDEDVVVAAAVVLVKLLPPPSYGYDSDDDGAVPLPH